MYIRFKREMHWSFTNNTIMMMRMMTMRISPTAPAITTATAAAAAAVSLADDARKKNPYLQAATQLAYAKHSRYRAPKSRVNTYYSTSSE
jgi:hypothetical protein